VTGVIAGNGNEHVVGQDAGVQKLEGAVFGGFNGGDISGQVGKCRPNFTASSTVEPPDFFD
jgi:hypothetical protein